MKLYEYQRSRSFIDLDPNHSDSIFVNFFSSLTADFNISSALRWALQDQWSSSFSVILLFYLLFRYEAFIKIIEMSENYILEQL